MTYTEDDIPNPAPGSAGPAIILPEYIRTYLWTRWDTSFANYRVKLKWGFFRPSFKIGMIFEPILIKYIGPRP